MKKFFYMISAALFSLTLCFSCAFALDYKNPNDYLDYEEVLDDEEDWYSPKESVRTLDQYGDLIIQEEYSYEGDIFLYDTKQNKELFREKSIIEKFSDDHTFLYYRKNKLYFTEDERILFSTWICKAGDLIEDIQTFELSPDGMKKTLLTEEYAITGQDIAGRFVCMTKGQSIAHHITKE